MDGISMRAVPSSPAGGHTGLVDTSGFVTAVGVCPHPSGSCYKPFHFGTN